MPGISRAPLRPCAVVPTSLATDRGQVVVTGITHASGQVRPGDLYAALPGARQHGAAFTEQAIESGAVAVFTDPAGAARVRAAASQIPLMVTEQPRRELGRLADEIYGRPSSRLSVIGITGTAGKTSTAYLAASGLRADGRVTGLMGTVETRLGDIVVPSVRTTPEATDLHALLAVAAERGVTSVVMEVSSHALALDRVGGVRFAVGGWTNFGLDHLDFHRDRDDYFAAKARLFDGRCQTEIVNADDAALRELIGPGVVTYSAAGSADASWYAGDITDEAYGHRFVAHGPLGTVRAAVALPGRHNVANALLALAALTSVGVDPQVAADGIAACPGVPGRLERVDVAGDVIGVVDYAHKPDAIVASLAALRALARVRGGRVICVLGAGGDRDTGKRPLMGAAAADGSDVLLVTDDNPRTEDPAAIRMAVLAGAAHGIEVPGRRRAIAEAVQLARPGDIVAILGKGHESGQEIGAETLPFDDRVELAKALQESS